MMVSILPYALIITNKLSFDNKLCFLLAMACDEGKITPDAKDCTSYMACIHGELVRQKCPNGLHFNKVLGACDWPASANCMPETTTPDGPTPSPTPPPPPPAHGNKTYINIETLRDTLIISVTYTKCSILA